MNEDTVKLILGYDKHTDKVIEELMRYFCVEDRAHLIRKGLALLELLRETNQNGDDFEIHWQFTKIYFSDGKFSYIIRPRSYPYQGIDKRQSRKIS